jgi:hypothetical protein
MFCTDKGKLSVRVGRKVTGSFKKKDSQLPQQSSAFLLAHSFFLKEWAYLFLVRIGHQKHFELRREAMT